MTTLPISLILTRRVGIAIGALCLAGGCVNTLAPAPPPAQVAPRLTLGAPPAAGQGRLVVDVVDGPTPVRRVRMEAKRIGEHSFRFSEVDAILCAASPCVADLPTGNVLLGFPVVGKSGTTETELVHVGPKTSVYRRSLSVYEEKSDSVYVLGIIGTVLGAGAAITGGTLLPIGLGNDNDRLALAGGITLGAGVILVTLSRWAMMPTYRPGSAVHFSYPSR